MLDSVIICCLFVLLSSVFVFVLVPSLRVEEEEREEEEDVSSPVGW